MSRKHIFSLALPFVSLLSIIAVAACGDASPTATPTSEPASPATIPPEVATQTPAPPAEPTSAGAQGSAPTQTARPIDIMSPAQASTATPPVVAPSATAAPAPTAAPPVPTPTPLPAAVVDQIMGHPDAVAAAVDQAMSSLYERVLPSVVHIRVQRRTTSGAFVDLGEGSGFVWDKQGHIVTNNHVVSGAARVIVIFHDGTEANATVLGVDPYADLAALKVDLPAERLTPVALGDDSEVKVGQMAIAIGNPFGQDFTMTKGIVSALGRTIEGLVASYTNPEIIQTDAPINPGNSGGPLLDRLGRVIGINTQIISETGGSAGIGFAVPVDTAKRVVPDLISKGKYEYAYLGISGGDLYPELAAALGVETTLKGIYMEQVFTGGPASQAGLMATTITSDARGNPVVRRGDIILALDGVPMKSMKDLSAHMVRHRRPGDTVKVTILRASGITVTVDVVVSVRPISQLTDNH
ncbi:MAG: trypsin-like serine protease [SAR202 cluster bacterium]|nr:trypsin-like serine protease [SAR202 cluster bacterium]